MAEESNKGSGKCKGRGLVLYHAIPSSYSQKARLALYEKKLNFKSELVDLMNGENFQPWFMKMNPKGEVPVLKDGDKIIPDSSRIIEYIEENYGDNSPRLIPDKGAEEFRKVQEMKKMLESTPFPVLTFGAVLYPELSANPKMSLFEKKARSETLDKRPGMLDTFIEKYPEFKNEYVDKKEKTLELCKKMKDISVVKKCMDDMEVTLDVVEKELASHTGEKESWFLCSSNFTIADVLLTLVLHRLDHVGFSERFFSEDKRPYVNNYYKRVQQRESFKKTFGPTACLFALIPATTRIALASMAGAVVIAGVALAATFAYKKLK